MYPLDLETMLAVLQQKRQTGIVAAAVPSGTAGMRDAGRVEITIAEGNVLSCRLMSTGGLSSLDGHKALQAVARLGRLDWSIAQPPSPEAFPARKAAEPVSSKSSSLSLPRRLVHLRPEQMASWSRIQRQVFALVDGRKSSEQIAVMLSTSTSKVEQVLRELQGMGVIVGV